MFNGDASTRTLYVGNLDARVSEELLLTLFGTLGQCKACKIIKESSNEIYAFIEYSTNAEAQTALMAMNKRNVLGKDLKVNWASQPGGQVKQDTSKHFHIFVGDLTPEIEMSQLKDAFAGFGEISDAKIITDPQTGRSKGFGFVCFVQKEDAELAITSMNGTWLGGRTIRTNWATGKGVSNNNRQNHYKELNYSEVQNQSGPNNTTVYCGGISSDTTESMIRDAFQSFGEIIEVRVFKEKGYSFVRYMSKEAAVRAICGVHGTEINGSIVKCSWGKEQSELQQQIANSQQLKNASLAAAAAASSVTGAAQTGQQQQQQNFFSPSSVPGFWAGYQTGYPNTFIPPFSLQGFGGSNGGFPSGGSSTWSSQASQGTYNGGSNGLPQPSSPSQQASFPASLITHQGLGGALGSAIGGLGQLNSFGSK